MKKLLSLLLTAALAITTIPFKPISVSADDVPTNGSTLTFTAGNSITYTDANGGTAQWNGSTLTLNNFTYSATSTGQDEKKAAISLPAGATIILADGTTNTINIARTSRTGKIRGIYSPGALTIQQETTTSNAAELNINAFITGTNSDNAAVGIDTNGNTVLTGGTINLKVSSLKTSQYSAGISIGMTNVLTLNNTVLNIAPYEGDSGNYLTYGIDWIGNLNVSNSTISITTPSNTELQYGILPYENTSFSDSNINITTRSSSETVALISRELKTFTMNEGTLNATAIAVEGNTSQCVGWSNDSVATINSGDIIVKGDEYGLRSSRTSARTYLYGGTLTAIGEIYAVYGLAYTEINCSTGLVAMGSATTDGSELVRAEWQSELGYGDACLYRSGSENLLNDKDDAVYYKYVKAAPPPPSVTAGNQDGALTYGTGGDAVYSISKDQIDDADFSPELEWYEDNGTTETTAPTGVSASFNAGKTELTLSTIAVTAPGTFKFKVKSGSVKSSIQTLVIDKKELTVTGISATDRDYEPGNTAVDLTGGTLEGIENNDDVSIDGGLPTTGTIADANAATGKAVTIADLALSGSNKDYYTIKQPEGITVDIAKIDPTVTWPTDLSAEYGDTLADVTLPGNGTNTTAGIFSFANSSLPVGNVGTRQFELTFTPTDTNNYNILKEDVDVEVGKADYDDTKTASVNVFKLCDTTDVTVTLPSIPTGASYGTPTSSDALIGTIKGITSGVLKFNSTSQPLGTNGTITIPVTGADIYKDYEITVTVNTIDELTVTITGVTISDKTYDKSQIEPNGTVSIEDSEGNNVTSILKNDLIYTYTGRDGTTYAASTEAPTNAGNYTLTISVPDDNPKYNGSASLDFTIEQRTVTPSVDFTGVTGKTYDKTTLIAGTQPTINFVVGSGILPGEMPAATATFAFSSADAGTNKNISVTNITLSSTWGTNYKLSKTSMTAASTLEITQKQLSWNTDGTVNDKDYDETTTATIKNNPTLSGVASGDTVTVVSGTVIFENANAGTSKTITASGFGISGNDNYKAPTSQPVFANAKINKIEYTGTKTASVGVTKNVAISGVTVDLPSIPDGASYGTPTEGSALISTIIGITAGVLTFDTTAQPLGTGGGITVPVTGATNYKDYDISILVDTINKLTVTISGITISDKTYDKDAIKPSGTISLTDPSSNDVTSLLSSSLIYTYSGRAGTDYTASTTAPTNAGNYTLTISVPDENIKYDGSQDYEFSINKITLTPSVDFTGVTQKTYDKKTDIAGTKPTIKFGTGSGIISGETPAATATFAFTTADAGQNKTIEVSDISLSGTWGTNYKLSTTSLSAVASSLEITQKQLSWNADGTVNDKDYDGTTTATIKNNPTLSGVVSGDTVTVVNGTVAFGDAVAGTSKTITASGYGISGNTNYKAPTSQPVFANAKINKIAYTDTKTASKSVVCVTDTADVEVTLPAIPSDASYGTPTSSGLLIGTISGITNGVLKFNTTKQAINSQGVITIPVIGAANIIDYNITVTITADIKMEVTFTGYEIDDKTYDGNKAALKSSKDILDSNGESVYLDISSSDIIYTYTGTGNTSYSNTVAPIDYGTYKLVVSIAGTNSTYEGTSDEIEFEIRKRELTVTGLTAVNRVYDATTDVTLTGGNLSGVIGSENVTAVMPTTGTTLNKVAGTSKLVSFEDIVLSGTDKSNYTLTQPTVTVNITPKTVEINLTVADKTYDGTSNATFSSNPSLIGIISGDAISLVKGTPTFANVNAGSNITINFTAFSLAATDAANYSLTQPSGITASINKKEITISNIRANDKVYDGKTDVVLDLSDVLYNGKVLGDSLTIDVTGAFDSKDAGKRTVNLSGLTLGGDSIDNYVLAASGNQATAPSQITKENSLITEYPTAAIVWSGDKISELTGGIASINGTFTWVDSETIVEETGYFDAVFTPTDTTNYTTIDFEVNVIAINKDDLDAKIAEANKIIKKAVIGEADGQYYQTVYDKFAASIKAAEAIVNDAPKTQTIVNDGYKALVKAIEEFIPVVIIIEFQPVSTIEKDVESDGIAPDASMNTKVEDLKNLVFTQVELDRIALGESAKVYLDVKDISDKVPALDKALVIDSIGEFTLGLYLDITLFKQIGREQATQIHKVGEKISITINIPEYLQSNNREYEIIRVHEGKSEVIKGVYNQAKNEFTFETELFSTYALIYKDTVTEEPTEPEIETETEEPVEPETEEVTEPEIQDETEPDEIIEPETQEETEPAEVTEPESEEESEIEQPSEEPNDNPQTGSYAGFGIVLAAGALFIVSRKKK